MFCNGPISAIVFLYEPNRMNNNNDISKNHKDNGYLSLWCFYGIRRPQPIYLSVVFMKLEKS